jgi:hypothetical protein
MTTTTTTGPDGQATATGGPPALVCANTLCGRMSSEPEDCHGEPMAAAR